MKAVQFFLLAFVFSLFSISAFAQSKKAETFDVSGNCGMCKKTIEKAEPDIKTKVEAKLVEAQEAIKSDDVERMKKVDAELTELGKEFYTQQQNQS